MDNKPASVTDTIAFVGGALSKRFQRQREADVKLENRSTWIPTAEKGWQGPQRKAAAVYIGGRFTRPDAEQHANGVKIGKRNKLARRMLRGKIMSRRTDVKKAIVGAQVAVAKAERLADNPHEKRRLLEEERELRRAEREERQRVRAWWNAWIRVWFDIGNAYGRLTAFAQAGMR